MSVLEGLKPESVFHYFEEISQIPHGSGNVRQISDYLKRFAEERGLTCIQDALYNMIIIKDASEGYEDAAPVILQGHMDMVAVAAPGVDIDMAKEPLKLRIDGGRIRAEGTSLGGDDGIAVAYILALLDAKDIPHPRLEAVLTVDEETGMQGAREIDLSMLRGRRLINLDQEEEGVIITSCAGGARVDVNIPLCREQALNGPMKKLKVKVGGLLGGHSGIEINKGRGNANRLLGLILWELAGRFALRLADMHGGLADNAIPREAEAFVLVEARQAEEAAACVGEKERAIRAELGDRDAGFFVSCDAPEAQGQTDCFDIASTERAIACLCELPDGVVAMSRELEGLVETSLNLGITAVAEGGLRLSYAVRSSVDAEREALCARLRETAAAYGAVTEVRNAYPGWAYRRDSLLRDAVAGVYEEMYGRKPVLEAIHAGVECGILAAKIPGLDCVSIGPDMSDVHTPDESLDIASAQRTWEFLCAILARR